MSQLVLVVGTGRSGTTLATEILARHPDVGFISGVDDKFARLGMAGRFNPRLYRGSPQRPSSMRTWQDSPLWERGRARVSPSEGYALLDREVMPGFSTPCRDLFESDLTDYHRTRLQHFFTRRMSAQGTSHFAHHLTGWPRTGYVRGAFPGVKVVNVVRDGRAVANSWLQMGWWDGWVGPEKWIYGPLPADLHDVWLDSGRSFKVLAGLGWVMLMRAYEVARAEAPSGSWLDVRHEDMLADPDSAASRVLEFVGLQPGPDVLAQMKVERLRKDAWRRELDQDALEPLAPVMDPVLERWGYQV